MDRHDRNLAQLQLLLLETERQLLIISAMIDLLRSRWGLSGGLPVIRQRRHRRYRFRPWPTRAELEEKGQYSRPMAMLHLDDNMAYRNFIQMPPELSQELEQKITAEIQRDRTLMRDPVSPVVKSAEPSDISPLVTPTPLCSMLSGWPPSRILCLRCVTLSPGPIEIRCCSAPHSRRIGC